MNIEFISIKVKNFRSYGNLPVEYEFYNGLDLITGTNGNGKTSLLLHGIIFNLFGTGINGENIDSLINNINKKNMVVELSLLANDVPYRIIRGRKPNILEIYENDSDTPKQSISAKADDAYIIENILGGIDKNIFLKLFAIQANNAETSIFRMSAADRRKLLESLFDLSIYTNMKTKNDENISILELDRISKDKENISLEQQLKILNNNVLSIEGFLKSIEERIKIDTNLKITKEKEIQEFETKTKLELEQLNLDLNKLIKEQSNIDIKDLEVKKDFFDKSKKQTNELIKSVNVCVSNITTNVNLLQNVKTQIAEIQKTLIEESKYNEIKELKNQYSNKIKTAREEITKIDSKFKSEEHFLLSVGECAKGNKEFLDCVKKKFGNNEYNKDEWDNTLKPRLSNDILTKEKEIKEFENSIKAYDLGNSNIKTFNQNLKIFSDNIMNSINELLSLTKITEKLTMNNFIELSNNKINEFNNLVKENEKDVELINKTIELHRSLTKDINNINNTIKEKSKLNSDNLNRDLTNIINSIDKSNKEIVINIEKSKQTKKDINEVNKNIDKNLKDLLLINDDLKAKQELSKFLKDEKIKYFIIKQSFPILKQEFNKILKRLFHGEIRVFIDNKFDITVQRNGEEQNFENFSEGEKKRLDLGFIFTVHEFLSQKNQISVNILIMDELLDSALDSVGTECVVDYLNEMKLTRNIILVTHRDENIDHNRRFIINKEKKFSIIKEI